MKKRIFYTEFAYVFGLIALAFGAALMETADYGVSMVVAPAYLLHLKISEFAPFFTFGMAEYTFQAFLLVVLVIVLRRFRVSYLFSFFTAVFYAFLLDGAMFIVAFAPFDTVVMRLAGYLAGLLSSSLGVSLMFRTYISAEVYELFVKETSQKFGFKIHRFKTCYDCVSCVVAVLMSFMFFGLWHFEGVRLGTVFCALVNGTVIGWFTRLFDKHFEFCDALKFRGYFEH